MRSLGEYMVRVGQEFGLTLYVLLIIMPVLLAYLAYCELVERLRERSRNVELDERH